MVEIHTVGHESTGFDRDLFVRDLTFRILNGYWRRRCGRRFAAVDAVKVVAEQDEKNSGRNSQPKTSTAFLFIDVGVIEHPEVISLPQTLSKNLGFRLVRV